ncbi:MAG: [Fe-Fe] hydrogenase large subunit C-terminal domain-containing protein [Bacillota bacterium]
MDKNIRRSVTLDKSKCIGCTNCIRHCPTRAIRVRGGKASIIDSRCIDCGECIRICSQHAKKPMYDEMENIFDGRYKHVVALPAPSLLAQFNNLDSPEYVIAGLLKMGFDSVFEVAKAAEIVSDYTRKYIQRDDIPKPVISSACPAVVRLVRVRYPDLCDHVLPVLTPVELAAKLAKHEVMKKTGLKADEICCAFISPCPAKNTAAKAPVFIDESGIDAVLSMNKVYMQLVKIMTREDFSEINIESGIIGISWAITGGEASALLNDQYLAADGIENVIKVLDEVDNRGLDYLDFIELNACTGGCVGGVLTVVNPFVAKARIKNLRKFMPISKNFYDAGNSVHSEILSENRLEAKPFKSLSDDPMTALEKWMEIEKIAKSLPGFDCGSCGAPTCQTQAEDIVLGYGRISDCIFYLDKEKSGLLKARVRNKKRKHRQEGDKTNRSAAAADKGEKENIQDER